MNIALFRDYKEENWHSMEVYADQLIKSLRKRYTPPLFIKEVVVLPNISRIFPASYKYARMIFRYAINPVGALFQRADIYHVTDHANSQLLAALDPTRTVITCHDLTAPYWMMRHVPLTAKKRIRFAVERWRLGFMRRAARIIAVSNATKQQIIKELGIPERNITVIPEGVDNQFVRVTDKKIAREAVGRLGLPKKYLLHVGTTYYNKNIEGLLKIFFSLARYDKALCLLKAGDPWTDEQAEIIRASEYSDRVHHAGFVATGDLPVIYSMATLLLQPSYAEGFGFTVLEAMACGCPVVVSDIPAMHEMVADAGLYIHPEPTKEDIAMIRSYLRSPSQRNRLAALGKKRAATYSWNSTAKKTYAVYKEVFLSQKK